MEDLGTWIAKKEVVAQTGLTERTLERKVKRGELRRKTRDIPGRKPLPVFHPEDVARLKEKTLTPVPLEKADIAKSRQLAPVSSRLKPTDRQADIATLAEATALAFKVYLTMKEAARFLGLSEKYVKKARGNGTLRGIKIIGVRGWRFHRDELSRHQVSESEIVALPAPVGMSQLTSE
jgi:excisionase family DNA binding protein